MIRAKISKIGEGKILCEALTYEYILKEIRPTSVEDGTIGTVVMNTKQTLGITKDAIPIIEQIFKEALCDGGSLGDIDWFESTGNGNWNFSWIGPIKREFTIGEEVYKARDASLVPLNTGVFVLLNE